MHSLLKYNEKPIEMAVEGLRNAERELLAFETAHPSIAPEPVPKGKHDLPDPAPEVAPHTHPRHEPHMAGKAAKHKDELAAKRDQFKNEVVTWGLCVEYIKWMREDSHREIEDVFAACLEEYRSRCTLKEEEEEVAAVEEQLNKLALELESMD